MPDPSLLPLTTVPTICGFDWYDDTTRARRAFEAAGATFLYVDMDQDAAAKAQVRGAAAYAATPVIVIPGGAVHVEPSDEELAAILGALAG